RPRLENPRPPVFQNLVPRLTFHKRGQCRALSSKALFAVSKRSGALPKIPVGRGLRGLQFPNAKARKCIRRHGNASAENDEQHRKYKWRKQGHGLNRDGESKRGE